MTTTDTDGLKERIASALWNRALDNDERIIPDCHVLADAVLPIVAAEVRKAKAEAWDECAHEADRRWLIGGQSAAILHDRSPYRATEHEAGDSDERR